MKSGNNKQNIFGLAKQATKKWKCDHVVYETKKGQWTYAIDKEKIKGEVIKYIPKVKDLPKEEIKEVKPKKDKTTSKL